jgi:hypothetical protein
VPLVLRDQRVVRGRDRSFSLVSGTTNREVLFVFGSGSLHTGTVTIKVTSTSKQVQIDALGTSAR